MAGLMMAAGSRGGISTLASDTFTASDGTALTAHIPELGAWVRNGPSSSGAGDPVINGNRVHNQNDANVRYHYLVTPSSPDYDITCDVVMRSDNNASAAGPAGRQDLSAVTAYYARYNTGVDAWQLFKVVNNAATQLGTNQAATLVVDQAYACTLSMKGTLIRLLVDTVVLISVTDAAVTAGAAGIRVGGAATSTTGVHLDNLVVRTN
jgi:hypothetical protein